MGLPSTAEDHTAESDSSARRRRRRIIEWIALIAFALVIAFVCRAFVAQTFEIPTDSMVPTLEPNDRVLVNKLAYRFRDPHRGDVVVFHSPPVEQKRGYSYLVKRIVGMPRDTIEGRDGKVLINGKQLEEPYLGPEVESKTFGPTRVPEGRYFMLGDNRLVSEDSTVWHSLKRSAIVGPVFVRIWPPSRVGGL